MAEILTYQIYGRLSLLKAAEEELKGTHGLLEQPGAEQCPNSTKCLAITKKTYCWVADSSPGSTSYSMLRLPGDWDKLMGILKELNRFNTGDYVVRKDGGQPYLVLDTCQETLKLAGVDGKRYFEPANDFTRITKALYMSCCSDELRRLGYSKGAWYESADGFTFACDFVYFATSSDVPVLEKEIALTGFVFYLNQHSPCPIRKCSVAKPLPSTEDGVPYQVKNSEVLFYPPKIGAITKVELTTIKALGEAKAKSLVLPWGKLSEGDLQLIAKERISNQLILAT
jgi:hypothetical protein